ncbi:MAG: nuclear transport factor 2 family protein [Acidobacteriia bacterium]|nr:nuclear transport factor 2 family protein [Terriglobia bacterium]
MIHQEELMDLARRYTAAWGSQDAASVAACYSADGSLSVNAGAPAVGRDAIAQTARSFMTALPDMLVIMDGLLIQGDGAVYQWTLIAKQIRISGFEEWQIGADGLIAQSRGHFDSAGYERQLKHGAGDSFPA